MRILVLRGGALGDFIVTLPTLQLLRQVYSGAHIVLIGNKTAAELARLDGMLDEAYSQHEARWAELYENALPSATLAEWLGHFELIINFWPDPDGTLTRHFPRDARQRFLTAPAHPQIAPAARHYCQPLSQLGLSTSDFQSRLTSFASPRTTTIALHPGSGSPKKNWPIARWRELCQHLQPHAPLLIIGSEPDSHAVQALSDFGQTCFAQPLPELARRLAGCRHFIGHDSGTSHLAAAVGTPCTLLFGPTDPNIWAPPGDHVHVMKSPDGLLKTLMAQDVARWVKNRTNHPDNR